MIWFKLFFISQLISHIKPQWQENQKNLFASVEDLISVIIEEYIPENESVTFYYDEAWKESELKPGETCLLRQTSSKYRQWMMFTYHKDETVQDEIFGNVISGEGDDKRPKVIHDNMIIYYNKSQCYIPEEKHSLRSILIKHKLIIFFSGITMKDTVEDCYNLMENIFGKQTQFVIIMLNSDRDTLKVRIFEMSQDVGPCDIYFHSKTVGKWNLSTGDLTKSGNFFPLLKPYTCAYPYVTYISQGDTECIINRQKSGDNFTTPFGACVDMLHLILGKALSVNQVLYDRVSTALIETSSVIYSSTDVILNEASTDYVYIPNFVASKAIGFENVSAVLINPPDADKQEETFININTNFIGGMVFAGFVLLLACRIINRHLHLNEFEGSLFLTLTWSIFLGFSVQRQPRGSFRIIFIAFVILSFFMITLYSQYLYSERTVGLESKALTIDELEKRGVRQMEANYFHNRFNTKSDDASYFSNVTWDGSMRYIITNINLMSSVRDVKYTVLNEHFIRPKFLYLAKNMPIELINNLILRSTQAGLDHKWKWKYQQNLSRASEKYGKDKHDVQIDNDENDDDDDIDNDDDDDYDDDDDDDDDGEEGYKPVYISDLYGPLILIYSLYACSAVVFMVEIIAHKLHTRR